MKKQYMTPDLEFIHLVLTDAVLGSENDIGEQIGNDDQMPTVNDDFSW